MYKFDLLSNRSKSTASDKYKWVYMVLLILIPVIFTVMICEFCGIWGSISILGISAIVCMAMAEYIITDIFYPKNIDSDFEEEPSFL